MDFPHCSALPMYLHANLYSCSPFFPCYYVTSSVCLAFTFLYLMSFSCSTSFLEGLLGINSVSSMCLKISTFLSFLKAVLIGDTAPSRWLFPSSPLERPISWITSSLLRSHLPVLTLLYWRSCVFFLWLLRRLSCCLWLSALFLWCIWCGLEAFIKLLESWLDVFHKIWKLPGNYFSK